MNCLTLLRRRPLLVSAAILLVLGATGCDGVGGGTRAATVEGNDISTARVLSLLKDRKVAADSEASNGSQSNLVGPGKDTFTKRAFADTLNQVVLAELLETELERRDLSVKSSDREAAKASLEKTAGASTIRKLPKELREFVIDFDASQTVLRKQLADKGESKATLARAQYDKIKSETPEQLLQFCVTGAVFTTEARRGHRERRLQAGDSLTEAVKGLQAQQVVGQEQCAASSQFPAEVQNLAVGRVSAPIENQGTFVVLRLARRKTVAFEDVRAELEKNLPEPGTEALQAEITTWWPTRM